MGACVCGGGGGGRELVTPSDRKWAPKQHPISLGSQQNASHGTSVVVMEGGGQARVRRTKITSRLQPCPPRHSPHRHHRCPPTTLTHSPHHHPPTRTGEPRGRARGTGERRLPYQRSAGYEFVRRDAAVHPGELTADDAFLKTKNGRKTVKSARYRPILGEDRRRQRPAHVYARADPAQNGGNGGN